MKLASRTKVNAQSHGFKDRGSKLYLPISPVRNVMKRTTIDLVFEVKKEIPVLLGVPPPTLEIDA